MAWKKYRIRCVTENAWVGSGWVEAVPTTCPNNPAHTINADATTVKQQLGMREDHIACGDATTCESKTTNTAWTCVKRYWYRGADDTVGFLDAVGFLARCALGTGYSVRLRDVTNNATIAKKEDMTNTTPTMMWDMSAANIPANGAMLELQLKAASGDTAYVSDVDLVYQE